MRFTLVYTLLIVGMLATACGEPAEPADEDGGPGVDASSADASTDDATVPADAEPPVDATVPADAQPDVDAASDAGSLPDAARACMLGNVCNDTQPCSGADFRCYGSGANGFCAPFAPECGGFVMTMCTGGRTCIRGGGSSLGYCATPEERDCICASAIENDITTDGCPARP